MLRHVVWCFVPHISKNCSDIIFSPRKLLGAKHDGSTTLRSFWDYLHKDAGQYPRRSETSAIPPLGKSISLVYVK